MTRLVDADALRDALKTFPDLLERKGINRALRALDAAPTIEPGRCGECDDWWLDVLMVDGTKPCRLGVMVPPTNWPHPDFGCVLFRDREETP